MQKIFVYGSLRKGMSNYDIYLKGKDSYLCDAYVLGTLYIVRPGEYPALLLEGNQRIVGEIHEVSDECMKEIDQLEEYISEGNSHNEYDKVICDIYDSQDQLIERLPVYVYNMRNTLNQQLLGEIIESGDFVKYIKEKEDKVL